MKIIFFGTANVALPILEDLIKEHEVLAVVTTPDAKAGRKQALAESPVSSLANDLKMNLLKPETVKGNAEFLSQLRNLNADLFVVVAYGKILPEEIISLPKYKSINIHFSPLPKYRGPSPIQAALLNGDEYTGTSFFILDEQVDHGPLLAQEIEKIEPGDNYFTLSDKLARKSALMIGSVIIDYTTGKTTPLPQDDSAATHTKHITKEDGKVNWDKSAAEIYNQFRAFFLWPGIWTVWNGKNIKITDCLPTELQMRDTTDDYRIGTVLAGGVVACGLDSYLQIKTLQLEGKTETNIENFLNGYREFVGGRLGG